MIKDSSSNYERNHTLKSITLWAIIGGVIGILIGLLHRTNILIIPGLNNVFYGSLFNEIITGILLGIIIGGLIGGALTLYSPKNTNPSKQETYNANKTVTLQIKEEQLNIAKKWIQTGEVKIYRDILTEEKTFTVPVIREELVIEKKSKNVPTETIRIPLSEEQVKFTKRKVALEDVSIYKQQIKDIKHIEETLKKEKVKVTTSGSPKVKNKLG